MRVGIHVNSSGGPGIYIQTVTPVFDVQAENMSASGSMDTLSCRRYFGKDRCSAGKMALM